MLNDLMLKATNFEKSTQRATQRSEEHISSIFMSDNNQSTFNLSNSNKKDGNKQKLNNNNRIFNSNSGSSNRQF